MTRRFWCMCAGMLIYGAVMFLAMRVSIRFLWPWAGASVMIIPFAVGYIIAWFVTIKTFRSARTGERWISKAWWEVIYLVIGGTLVYRITQLFGMRDYFMHFQVLLLIAMVVYPAYMVFLGILCNSMSVPVAHALYTTRYPTWIYLLSMLAIIAVSNMGGGKLALNIATGAAPVVLVLYALTRIKSKKLVSA